MSDGFKKVPNEIYDALLRQPLTDIERRTAFLIVRLTNGWQKPSDEASYGFMADYIIDGILNILLCQRRAAGLLAVGVIWRIFASEFRQ